MGGLQSGNIMLRRLKLKQAKVNISVCSLKLQVKVKVNKFCVGWEELINAYKPTKLSPFHNWRTTTLQHFAIEIF